MKLKLNPLQSDIFIAIFVVVSLYFRFSYEANQNISPFNSIVIGLAFITILWALIKLGVLNPNWFGLFNKSNKKKMK